MKRSLILLFLIVMLLCGVLLHAADNSIKIIRVEKPSVRVIKADVKKEMEFVPNIVLL